MLAETRRDQVPDAGQSENVACSAPSATPKRHLHHPARDERRLRVVAETETVAYTGRDADDVLEPGQFDAEKIGVGVNAKAVGAETLLRPGRQSEVGRSRRRPMSASRATSSAWLGPLSTIALGSQGLGNDFRRPAKRPNLQAFVRLTAGTSLPRTLRNLCNTSRRNLVGIAVIQQSAPSTVSAGSLCHGDSIRNAYAGQESYVLGVSFNCRTV